MDIQENIIKLLDSSQRGLSVSEIADKIKMDRRTVAKQLEVMEAKSIISHEKVGMAKLWSLSRSPLIALLVKDDDQSMILKNILNTLDEGISILDKDLRIIWVNEKIKGMAQRLSHLQGRRCYETYLNRKDICASCPALKTFKSSTIQKSIEKGKDKDGNPFHYQFVTAPIKDRSGQTIAIIETVRDLSGLGL
ncbi:PAS domain-containing protein [Candidatus Woesearchaeota archaeon]|nr:PAS domain-containing protein [Candidatus Woesearchaeota archaeon]